MLILKHQSLFKFWRYDTSKRHSVFLCQSSKSKNYKLIFFSPACLKLGVNGYRWMKFPFINHLFSYRLNTFTSHIVM